MRLDSDDFEIFGLPRCFALSTTELDSKRVALLTEVHPDRFASADSASRRTAMQWAVRVNEAHARLKDPLRRAAYLCQLAGADVRAEDNTAMPPDFLLKQMAWREALDDADERQPVEALLCEVTAERAAAYERLATAIDGAGDYAAAAGETRALMFVERFAADLDERLAAMEA